MFDAQTLIDMAIISLAGGIIGLDRTAAGQFMISQPIVAGPLAGWILGDVETGLMIGVILELIWLLDMPVGTFVPADSTVSVIFSVASAVIGSAGGERMSAVGFSILLTAALAPVTMAADRYIRKRNSRLAERALFGAGGEIEKRLSRAHIAGLAAFFLKFFAMLAVFVPLGASAVRWFTGLPDAYHRGMELFVRLLPMLGAASVLRRLSVKNIDGRMLAGFLAAVILGVVLKLNAIIITLIVVGAGWIWARRREAGTTEQHH